MPPFDPGKSRGTEPPGPYALIVSAYARRDLEDILSALDIASLSSSHRNFPEHLRPEPPKIVLIEYRAGEQESQMTLKMLASLGDIGLLALVGDEEAGIEALRLGADATAVEPVDAEALQAQIEALLQRFPSLLLLAHRDGVLEFDGPAHYVAVEGQEVSLTPTEFKLLAVLISAHGGVVRHDDLLERVWGDRFRDVGEVKTYISYLRRKLGPGGQYLENVRGIGYRYRIPWPHR